MQALARCLSSFVVSLLFLMACAVQAQESASNEAEVVLPLARLLGQGDTVRVTGVEGSLSLSLPMPALQRAERVHLELVGTASQALIESSQAAVLVNGRVAAQFALDGRSPSFRQTVTIPTALLHTGYNDVQLLLAQHYARSCEYAMAPQLWTQIDLQASRFRIQAGRQPVPLRLDRLEALFDKVGWDSAPQVPVLTASSPSAPLLGALALVAQGIGQRYDFVPVRLAAGRFPTDIAALGHALPAGSEGAVLLGTFDQLRSYLAGLSIPQEAGPVVALRALPGDPHRYVLVLAAQTEAELERVAGAFAMERMPWPDTPWVAVEALKLPPLGSVTGAAAGLKPSTNAFPLSALGYHTTTYRTMSSGAAVLRFWNPSWQGRAQVRIHAAYASGMSVQSALNVLANGALHGSIPLDNPAGGRYENYAVTIPPGALRPGWNTLELQPVLVPRGNGSGHGSGADCQPFFPGNLAVTLYDDSTLQTFGGSPLRQPDLALLARDGRVAPTAPVGLGMAVQLTDAEDTTVSAGLTLLAKLTQVFSGPLMRTAFAVGPVEDAKNRLWVGPLARLPASVRQAVGLSAAGRVTAPVPLIRTAGVRVHEGGDLLMRLSEALDPDDGEGLIGAQVSTQHAFGDQGLAATVDAEGLPLTVFTASTPQALQAALDALVDHGLWSQLGGRLAFWRPGADTLQAVRPEDAPFTAYSLRGGLGLWVSQYPWWSLFGLLVLLTLLVMLTRAVLASYRRRHLPAQAGLRRDDERAR